METKKGSISLKDTYTLRNDTGAGMVPNTITYSNLCLRPMTTTYVSLLFQALTVDSTVDGPEVNEIFGSEELWWERSRMSARSRIALSRKCPGDVYLQVGVQNITCLQQKRSRKLGYMST